MRYGTQSSSASYPPKASSTSHLVFLSMISRWLPTQAAQSSSVWHWYKILNNELSAYDSVSPSVRSATVGSETRISQNKGMPRESDISSYRGYTVKFVQVPRIRKNSWYASDNLTGYASEGKPVGDARIDKS
jgi:hypothetical protein